MAFSELFRYLFWNENFMIGFYMSLNASILKKFIRHALQLFRQMSYP